MKACFLRHGHEFACDQKIIEMKATNVTAKVIPFARPGLAGVQGNDREVIESKVRCRCFRVVELSGIVVGMNKGVAYSGAVSSRNRKAIVAEGPSAEHLEVVQRLAGMGSVL